MPDTANHYETLGVARNATPTDIKRAYFSLVRMYPPETHPQDFQRLSAAYEVLRDPEARKRYDSESLVPPDARNLLTEAEEALRAEHPDRAASLLRKALVLHPEFQKARNLLGVTYLNLGRYGEAIGQFERVLRDDPENPVVLSNLAQACLKDHRYTSAEGLLRQVYQKTKDATYLLELSEAYCSQKRWAEAERVLEVELVNGIDPADEPGIYSKLLLIHWLAEAPTKWQDVAYRLARFVRAHPETAEALLADVLTGSRTLTRLGSYEWSERYLNLAAAIDSNNDSVRSSREYLVLVRRAWGDWARLKEDETVHQTFRGITAALLDLHRQNGPDNADDETKEMVDQIAGEFFRFVGEEPYRAVQIISYLKDKYSGIYELFTWAWEDALEKANKAKGNPVPRSESRQTAAASSTVEESSGNGCAPFIVALVVGGVGAAMFGPFGFVGGAWLGWKLAGGGK